MTLETHVIQSLCGSKSGLDNPRIGSSSYQMSRVVGAKELSLGFFMDLQFLGTDARFSIARARPRMAKTIKRTGACGVAPGSRP
jgi:hypothetical protein